ncbi:binding-protein-dependent transport systems inner membrane component [Haladaptatus paucihalophilus DX253]|uniref:Binding-protein-dependent transport systems inner membrane component n=1 Tax=Haladaptatus paucihalophilus DX253 TaxID=797209 RepID=E7QZL2_HALPU|nr:ABC transporter permease [Haladaptatus paucihalophilus]EFW90133.1 binding-protein-dependent transport systems inner membrane component [Haladaptatus paucihalophilus DX253]SHL06553.1 osmoprotectant transport system permease protein [Haladaptatus paucihalophilus DX253]
MFESHLALSHAVTPLALESYVEYLSKNQSLLWELLINHIIVVIDSVWLAVVIGVPLGILATFDDRLGKAILWTAGMLMTVPSIALFGLLIPLVGIGKIPVVIALVLYAQLPIVRNTYVGLTQVDSATIEAGRGMGMTRRQRLQRIQLPQAIPVIMAGVRNAVVILIGIAAIGAFIGANNLGDPIFSGISEAYPAAIVVSTVAVSLLALAFDYGFGVLEQLFRLRNGEDVEQALATRIIRRSIA